MIKKFFMPVMALIFFSTTSAWAQNGGGNQHQTVQERVSNVMGKLTPLNLDAATTAKADSIFTDFFTSQQKIMEAMRAGGQVDRDAMRTQRQQLMDDRDNKLKQIFTADQFTKWKNDIEPSLRPQHGNRQSDQQPSTPQ